MILYYLIKHHLKSKNEINVMPNSYFLSMKIIIFAMNHVRYENVVVEWD